MKRLRPVLFGLGVVAGVAVGFGLYRKYGGRAGDTRSFAMFGETKTMLQSEPLTTADATAVFGAVTLDLREALVDDEATVDCFALFGGIEVLIPKRWRLALSGTPIFGGVEDKTTQDDPLPPEAPILNVNAVALFGGVAIANEPGEATRRTAAATT
ncbi:MULTISPECIES: LiaF domain-containing protein [unclassified Kribbella]|uniref:LiaF domain-containing protein n=1 Tax=unclassified Kribbella TaxID=2644121 RepID=UPI003019D8A8